MSTSNDLEKLKSLRANVNWEIEKKRVELLPKLVKLFGNWTGRLPNLRDVFRPAEIDWLLSRVFAKKKIGTENYQGERFVDFVIRTGYKDDQPETSARRTTPLHHAAKRIHDRENKNRAIGRLFEIYDRLDVNYVDEAGSTHFHVACMAGCREVVEKFLEQGRVDPDGVLPKTGESALHLALTNERREIVESLLKAGADPNLADKDGTTPLHIIGKRCTDDDDDLVDKFFEISEEKNRPVRVDAKDESGNTPLLLALYHGNKRVARTLLSRGADPDLAGAGGLTPLHVIGKRRRDVDGLAELFLEVLDEVRKTVRIDARDDWGWTPLHWTMRFGNKDGASLLLRRGADVNLANNEGSTPLHISSKGYGRFDTTKMLLDNEECKVDVRDKWGNTALHLALGHSQTRVAKSLLRRDADPNAANEEGETPLHVVCAMYRSNDLLEMFFEVNDDIRKIVRVDAKDKKGNTPLHLALRLNNKKMAECLVKRGADINLANEEGSTPMHVIAKRDKDDGWIELFFGIVDDVRKMVRVDVQDKSGRTPLQWAVANLKPNAIDVLLNRGAADLSNFVFPTVSHFDECLKSHRIKDVRFKSRLPSIALDVVDRLEKRGYEPSRSDASTIVKLFVKYEFFEEPTMDLDEKFAQEAKKTTIDSGRSLYDLIQSRAEEAEKLFTDEDYTELKRSKKLSRIKLRLYRASWTRLRGLLARAFFQQSS
ncbi:ankyrin-1-like [Trichogramma pretiosum]|uniref:ankyrin-1-like n=1 Tax=Trichogramma pretiosum TaxID=7493 RepID=UPI0006C98068|nr:ankyrin-1-like [Trichogramma pretiosum]